MQAKRCKWVIRAFAALASALLMACDEEWSGMDDSELRKRMVTIKLEGRDITNRHVLEAMRSVPRHALVPEDKRPYAYQDRPLPIGYGQTISQPYIVALMTQVLQPEPDDVVLEIGTGSGYQAAVLSKLVNEVYSIEIVEPLGLRAKNDLEQLSYTNIQVRIGDGYQGWPEAAPFDAIIVTCAPEKIPAPLVEQLKEGGRMIIPVGPTFHQALYLLEKKEGQIHQKTIIPVRFVPMTGKAQKQPESFEFPQ